MNKRAKLLLPILCLSLLIPVIPGKAAEETVSDYPVIVTSASEEDGVMPMSDDIRWVYITKNGQRYKRLFNFSTNQWIGDWIPVS